MKKFVIVCLFIVLFVIVSANIYYPFNTNSTCVVDTDCTLSLNLTQLPFDYFFYLGSFPESSPPGHCVNVTSQESGQYVVGCPEYFNYTKVYTNLDDYFSLNYTLVKNYSEWYVNFSSSSVRFSTFDDPQTENLSKLYSVEAKCIDSICGKEWVTLGGEIITGYGSYSTSMSKYYKGSASLEELKNLIMGGGSFRDVIIAYNSDIYPQIIEKWSVMWSRENFNQFPSNTFNLFVLLIKYVFRQPASLVPSGGFDRV
jgi:hypothetical protein